MANVVHTVLDGTEPEPRWHALLALLAVSGLYMALPASLVVGPRWLLASIVAVLLVPLVASHRTGRHRLNHLFGLVTNSVMTIFVVWSVVRLLVALEAHEVEGRELLVAAGSLWLTNVAVFALWYWRLDAGGPHERDRAPGHRAGAFLFPQMTMEGQGSWAPNFVDYLFLAFNASTALSPTDTPVLSRWAKLLMMVQSIVSLAVIAVLAARAVNVL